MSLGTGDHCSMEQCPWLCVSVEGFQRWLVRMSSCCPFEISRGRSEHRVALIINLSKVAGWEGTKCG